MITATGIRRPENELALGTHVRYHHTASVMRKDKEPSFDGRRHWSACDVGYWPNPWPLDDEWELHVTDPRLNKTVAVRPEEGSGVVISLIRKGIGSSHGGYTSGWEYPEYEPGYFDAKVWVWLYVVKHSMRGLKDMTLVPTDAIEVVA